MVGLLYSLEILGCALVTETHSLSCKIQEYKRFRGEWYENQIQA